MTRGFFLSLCVAVLLSPALRAEDFFADLTALTEADFAAAAREQLAAKGDADLLQRFDAAERAWEKYAEEEGLLYFCPIPGEAGNHTPRHAFFGITLPLYAHHERFLEKLAGARNSRCRAGLLPAQGVGGFLNQAAGGFHVL